MLLTAIAVSLGLAAPEAKAQMRSSSLNPCPGIYYEAPLNQRFLSPEGLSCQCGSPGDEWQHDDGQQLGDYADADKHHASCTNDHRTHDHRADAYCHAKHGR